MPILPGVLRSSGSSSGDERSVRRREAVAQQDGDPGRTRTCDTRFRKPVLYPLSYGADDAEDTRSVAGSPAAL